jgi:hypothetical protein
VTELNLQGEKGSDGKYKMTWELSPYSQNPFCGGTSMLSNGSILIVGGDQKTVPDFDIYDGTKGKRIYSPCQTSDCKKGEWTKLPDMGNGRWYPTVVTTGDGR